MNYTQQLLTEGGPVIYLLLALLFLSIVIFLERYFLYHRSHPDTQQYIRGIFNNLRNKKIYDVISNCEKAPNYPVFAVVRAIVSNYDKGEPTARTAAEEAYMTEYPKLRRGLKLLACLGNIAPILGLLGTLLSLMNIFEKISQDGHFVPTTELAGDVKSALLTTALGLIVAMLVHLFYFILTEKLEKIVNDMEKACAELISFLFSQPLAENKREAATQTASAKKPLKPETPEKSNKSAHTEYI